MRRSALMLGPLGAVVIVFVLAASALAGTWSLSLVPTPNPVAAGNDATFDGTLLNPGGQGVPNVSVVVRAYGHDATCTGVYAEIGPVLTSNAPGDRGAYTVSSGVPTNALGTYYVKAFATLDEQIVESACTALAVTAP